MGYSHPYVLLIVATGPDICFRNKKTNTFLIDISCSADGSIARKQAEKLTKYSDMLVEVGHMWQCIARWLDIISGQSAALTENSASRIVKSCLLSRHP